MANPTPQPNPTTGIGTAARVRMSGTGITQITGNEYTVTLGVVGMTTTTVTPLIQDVAGSAFTSGNSNIAQYVSRSPSIATVGATSGIITAVSTGQAEIEVQYATFDGTNSVLVDKIYATVLSTVTVNTPVPGPVLTGLGNFGMLGIAASTGSAATSGNAAHVASDVGSRTAINNFPPTVVDSPFVLHSLDDSPTETAITAFLAAYADLSTRTPGTTYAGDKNLGGLTLGPGIYRSTSTFSITTSTNLTLNGSATDVWVFQATTAMTTGATCQVILTGGALAKNVYWVMGTSMTLGATNVFNGSILAGAAINVGDTVTVHGRCLAQTAVTLTGNLIVLTLP
jgi:hypothetical protein